MHILFCQFFKHALQNFFLLSRVKWQNEIASLSNSMFFHAFVKHKRDLRCKYVLVSLVFLSSNFPLSNNDNKVNNSVKLCNCLQLYSPDYISTCNELYETCLLSQFSILTISKLKALNNNNNNNNNNK